MDLQTHRSFIFVAAFFGDVILCVILAALFVKFSHFSVSLYSHKLFFVQSVIGLLLFRVAEAPHLDEVEFLCAFSLARLYLTALIFRFWILRNGWIGAWMVELELKC